MVIDGGISGGVGERKQGTTIEDGRRENVMSVEGGKKKEILKKKYLNLN